MKRRQFLRKFYQAETYIPIFLGLSFLLLLLGLFLPAIHLQELIFFRSTFSVVTGIYDLFHERHFALGVIIILFSVIFPLLKLLILNLVWFFDLANNKKLILVKWLGILGKWSMLDVFVVAVTVVITQISNFAKAEPRIGIYFFGVSIILTMITTERISKILKDEER